eukprot:GCRY01002622.1.p1 GENE.GCRY01002622.1~~GCRY01002622.1.p1  ORF type:complete len:415 (-),score=114.88 GCRY01002622.1:461-1705(-)
MELSSSFPKVRPRTDTKDILKNCRHPLHYNEVARQKRARAGVLTLPHDVVHTPIFMPVGTQGTVKGLTTEQLESVDCHIILGNTYHLGHRPGADLVEEMGGLHTFMKWKRNILTDSGGFQMVSLLKLCEITEEGVQFRSPHDGSMMQLTPEQSIHFQNQIGSDIMMQLDDVVHSLTTGPRVREAMLRSVRWLDRCIAAHARPKEQNLFAIIQGGLDLELRKECVAAMTQRDVPGFAIGGLSGGEDKNQFWRVVACCTDLLPRDKPIYLMGVGYALDLVVCVALGVDMFDCVFPSRTGRFGSALVPSGALQLKQKKYADDFLPIDEECECPVCRCYTRAYLHTIVKEESGMRLITLHNIAYQLRLTRAMREAILANTFDAFVRRFLRTLHPDAAYPQWAVDALAHAGIELSVSDE